MQAETAEAAEMLVMEAAQMEAEEQLDIETAVKSAQESDQMLGDIEQQTDRVAEAEKAETAIASHAAMNRQRLFAGRYLYPMRHVMWVWMKSWLKQPVPEEAPRTSLINRISGLWSGKTRQRFGCINR